MEQRACQAAVASRSLAVLALIEPGAANES
jgi:hypothetical protein